MTARAATTRDRVALAWCAGLFDGEGCIGVYRAKSGYIALTARIVMVDRESVETFHRMIGAGTLSLWSKRPGARLPVWCWFLSARARLREVLIALRPFVVKSRAEIDLALAFIDANPEDRAALASAIKALKSRPGNRG